MRLGVNPDQVSMSSNAISLVGLSLLDDHRFDSTTMSQDTEYDFESAVRLYTAEELSYHLESDSVFGSVKKFHQSQWGQQEKSNRALVAVFYNPYQTTYWAYTKNTGKSEPEAVLSNHHWALKSGREPTQGYWSIERELLQDDSEETFSKAVRSICDSKLTAMKAKITEQGVTAQEYWKKSDLDLYLSEEEVEAFMCWRDDPFTLDNLLGRKTKG